MLKIPLWAVFSAFLIKLVGEEQENSKSLAAATSGGIITTLFLKQRQPQSLNIQCNVTPFRNKQTVHPFFY